MAHGIQRKLALAMFIGMTAMGLAACEEEGPAEKAGENVDQAMDEAGENIDESMDKAGETVEEMGDSVEQAADEADSEY
ncbi:hypothetical protein [Halomonas organivorans]|uniref:YtxH domain-containing protein n=1 Tax=Halomonas organivorans TaxID=257772 RepID=A0A7W5G7G2_9GAMM|nr:hypothetical protein [Halomonas organivorans]MBB3143180.1 hypothetical protein [Halomonas organivorans]